MKNKKILLILVFLLLAAAIAAGIFFMGQRNQETVGVYPFHMVGMDGYWGDSQESYGPVSTDKIQTVYLSDTQTVTEIKVAQGDTVKKGDVLMTFDTTLSDLQVERKRLEVEKLKLQLEEAKVELKKILALKPMKEPEEIVIPDISLPEVTLGGPISGPYVYAPYVGVGHYGLSAQEAFICWIRSDTQIDIPLLDRMRRYIWDVNGMPTLCDHGNLPDSCELCEKCEHDLQKLQCPVCNCTHGEECPLCRKCEHDTIRALCTKCSPLLCKHGEIEEYCEACHLCVHGKASSECLTCSPKICIHLNIEEFCTACHPPKCIHGDTCTVCHPPVSGGGEDSSSGSGGGESGSSGTGGETTDPVVTPGPDGPQPSDGDKKPAPAPESNYDPGPGTAKKPAPTSAEAFSQVQPDDGITLSAPYRVHFLSSVQEGEEGKQDEDTGKKEEDPAAGEPALTTDMEYYVVFKTTFGDTELAPTDLWQGVRVIYKDGIYSQQFFTPMINDYSLPAVEELPPVEIPDTDMGSGLTATQIGNMRIEQEKKIKEIEFNIKLANAEYKIMLKEVSDGHIYAEIDGQVVSLLTEEEAKNQKQPVVKVSGGGGFFITGAVSELEKDNLKIGQEVTVNDWSNGGMYTGTVREIGDFPSLDGYWNGAGNPNTTYYPFTVFVDGEASLQAGSYANIQYSTSEESGGIYMDKAFVRTEDGRSYVYIRGADDRLEKRFVTTGKNLWGSYLEITSGITVEDYIAFPYGKTVKPGAPAEEKDLADLYGY